MLETAQIFHVRKFKNRLIIDDESNFSFRLRNPTKTTCTCPEFQVIELRCSMMIVGNSSHVFEKTTTFKQLKEIIIGHYGGLCGQSFIK